MFKVVQILLLFLLIFSSCNKQKEETPDQFNEIDQYIKELCLNDRFHGSVTIGNQDSILYEIHQGIANRNWEIPIGADTRFDIASINKSFIAGLILIAVEEGIIKLEDRLVDLLNNFNYSGNFNDSITVHHMLTHSSGLPDYDGVSSEMSANGFARFKRQHFSNEAYTDYISHIQPIANPGRRFYYSNFAYHLLCIILEEAYQKPFPQLLKEKICNPLSLENTFSSIENEAISKNLATGYNWDEKTNRWYQNNFIDLTLGRRIFSNSTDLLKWARAMNDERLFSKKSLQLISTNHLKEISKDFAYGYGWVIIEPGNQSKMGNMNIDLPYLIHGGSTEGYKSILVNIDNGKYIISLLSNVGDRTNEMEMADKITKLLMQRNEQ